MAKFPSRFLFDFLIEIIKVPPADFLLYISGTGKCCHSTGVTCSDGKDETLSAEPIDTNYTIQADKVSSRITSCWVDHACFTSFR